MIVIIILFSFLVQAKPNATKPIIVWATDFTKPFNIKDGPRVGEGTEEILIRGIEQELKKKYKLDEWDVPLTRTMAFFKSKNNYCYAGMMKTTEREQFTYYSPFYSVAFSHVLISKKGFFDSIPKPLSLKKIIQENKYIIGIEQSSSYGMLDSIVKDGLTNHHSSFFLRPGVGSRDALFKMLQSNRIQMSLGNLEETIYFQKILAEGKGVKNYKIEIDFHSLSENLVKYNPEYIGCSKSPQGKLIIEDIAKIIRSKEFDRKKKAMDGAKKWFDAKTLALFEQYFDEELKKNP